VVFQVVQVKGMTVVRKSKYSNLNIIQQAVTVLSYYLQICALAEFWSLDATTKPTSIIGHNACWYIVIISFEEGKYHSYVRVIDTDLQNRICVLLLVLALAEVVNDVTGNDFYSFYCFVVVFCSFCDWISLMWKSNVRKWKKAVMPKRCETKQNLFCCGHRKVFNLSFKW
jgi:hypothetical protein